MHQTLDNLIQLIGHDAAMKLVDAHGGTNIYIPQPSRCSDAHELAQLIGMDKLLALSQFYARTMLSVPRALDIMRNARNARIRALAHQYSQRQLARMFDLTERQIRTILSGHHQRVKPADNQLPLF